MNLFEKSCYVLELPSVLNMLSNEAVSTEAKEQALRLQPLTDISEIREQLSMTSSAKKLMETNGGPGFSGVKDVVAAVRRADYGGVLNTVELLDIASLLRSASSVLSYRDGNQESTSIDHLFYSLRPNKYLENKITTCIIGEDEISDSASKELSDIRRHMRLAGDRARQSLNKIITSSTQVKYLQEPIITMRNERFVVPVKAEFRGAIPGLVHDISSSGATLFIEPMSTVQANNEIRELLAKEKKEIDRILAELSAEVAQFGQDIIMDFKILVSLDLIFAKAKFSYRLDCSEPAISENCEIRLRAARHPLLEKSTAVPVDITLGGEYDTLVVTGPNTGGKTVTLKTTGLLCLMAQCGLHIPVRDGSTVPVFKGILADIGDEQSIEQSLSTFSAHMRNIVSILQKCDENTLVLFDELGAGTDPTEGAALAVSIIEYVRSCGALVAATTHYAELKEYALITSGVQNASCEFDVETLQPTYRLLIGVPGKSNAFAISSRLGLFPEIIADAKKRIDSDSREFEDILVSLEEKRQLLEKQEQEIARLLRQTEEDKNRTEELRKKAEEEKEKAAVVARREANRILKDARKTAEQVFEELSDMKKKADRAEWQQMNEKKSGLFKIINESEQKYRDDFEEEVTPIIRPAVAGDRVKLLSLGTEAEVISVSPDGTLLLRAGIMKVSASQEEVRVIPQKKEEQKKNNFSVNTSASLNSSQALLELDVRGMSSDEAVPLVERFLDHAKISKLKSVTIIHGKGTGVLRKAVHECLKKEKGIKGFRLGRYGEGESGVTIVEFK